MGLFDRFQTLNESLNLLDATGANPFDVAFDEVISATEAMRDGKKLVLVGTNNYLGLTYSQACIDAAVNATKTEGTGTTGSRIANGTYGDHKGLEDDLAEFYGKDHAMVFSTGFQANLGVISTVAGPEDTLLIDSDSHASIYDACALGNAKVLRFRHNDPANLDDRLRRLGDEGGNKVVVLEGIYSMLGDTAPLKEFVDVCKARGAFTVLDEAHSMGVLGHTGQGLCEAAGLTDDIDIIVGTFSKSLGAVGGFCASSLPDFGVMRVVCRPYMFSASLPPAIIASVRAALGELRRSPELRARLERNIDVLYNGMLEAGFQLGPERSPIVAIHAPNRELAVDCWRKLLDAGYYVNLALSPATPGGVSLLRCSVSAAHEPEQLEGLVAALTEIALQNGALERPAVAAVAE